MRTHDGRPAAAPVPPEESYSPFFRAPTIWALAATSLLPYAAFPVGSNTNLPVCSIVSVLLVARFLTMPQGVVAKVAFVVAAPLAAAITLFIATGTMPPTAGLLAWVAYLAPLTSFAYVAHAAPRKLAQALTVCLIISSIFVLAQKLCIENGFIPFLTYYTMPGYADVAASAESILLYHQRPFGLFPEPSLMAGSLALGGFALLALSSHLDGRVRPVQAATVLLVCVAVFLSESGSAIVSCGALALCLALLQQHRGRRQILVASAVVVGLWGARSILRARAGATEWSWDERIGSIMAALRFQSAELTRLIVGSGRGSATDLFSNGLISTPHLGLDHRVPDVYSVTVRMLFESGALFGGVSVAILGFAVWRGARSVWTRPTSALFLLAWAVVATLTISYDSAVWVWAAPGMCLGLITSSEVRGRGDACSPRSK